MNLYIRLLIVWLTCRWRSKVNATDKASLDLHVWPNDLDLNFHMNNGRYLTIMDVGRIDLMMRSGMVKIIHQRRWFPVVANQKINYRRSLKPFQKYTLTTEVIGWDEKWVFMEQNFDAGGERIASAIVKAAFRKRTGGRVEVSELIEAMGHDGISPAMSGDQLAGL